MIKLYSQILTKKEDSILDKKPQAITKDQSAQTEKPDLKPATSEEVNQLVEDRKVEFNQNWHFKLNANAKRRYQTRCRCIKLEEIRPSS